MNAIRVAPFLLRSACLIGLLSLAFMAHGQASSEAVVVNKAQAVTSRDGTRIVYDQWGHRGPAVIVVGGALSDRSGSSELAQLMASRLTVYSYDRRGRGDSGDTPPYAVQREIEDIEALIDRAGGSAYVYGKSSGAALAIQASAALGHKVRKLALYEAPYNEAEGAAQEWRAFTAQLDGLLAANRRDEAITLFMKFVGAPDEVIDELKTSPAWPGMLAMAPTIAYDNAVVGEDRAIPVHIASQIRARTLVMDGSASACPMPYMRTTADKLGRVIPHAHRRVVEGQAHDVSAKAMAPILLRFFD